MNVAQSPAASRVREGLAQVQERIEAAAGRAGRDSSEVTLAAITKQATPTAIREAHALGHRDFGENRAQGLVDRVELGLKDVRWHFVGRLQSNKARIVTGLAWMVHSVDRQSLVDSLSECDAGKTRILVQVNTSGEAAKAGLTPDDALRLVDDLSESERIRLEGLMTMTPLGAPESEVRTCFRRLASLRDQANSPMIRHLSMGMSQDYEVAIEEGATIVRIGRAIFGA